jgi:hypothetical protein
LENQNSIRTFAPTNKQQLKIDTMSKEIFNRIITMGVRMVLDGTQVGMAVAVLARTNGLEPAQAVRLKEAIIEVLR